VSTAVGHHPTVSAVPSASAILRRPGVLASLAVGGAVVAVGAALLLGTSSHLVDPVGYGLQVAVMIVGTVGAALYWLLRRPGDRLGIALLAQAVAITTIALQGASNPLLHSLGVLADMPVFILGYYVVFAYPDGRLAGRLEQLVLAGFGFYFLTAFVPWFFFSPIVAGGAPLAGCNADCPTNALMIADRPTVAESFGTDTSYLVIVLASATLAVLIYRLATATRPRKRALLPVYVPAVMLTVPVLIFHGVVTQHLDLEPGTISDVGWFLTAGRMLLPYGFLVAIVLSAFFAASALKTIVSRLADRPDAPELRRILADALDEPALELAVPVDRAGTFVDSSGKRVVPAPAAGRTLTPVNRNGDTVAVIMHDSALNTDPELVGVAGQALLLALDNGRLEDELRVTTEELRASRARIVAAGDAERRKIERDLHDGAQQHLVALRVKVGLAGELAEGDPQAAARLADLGTELEEILQELRDLAQGLYPPVLRQFGLREALASVARRSTPPPTIEAAGIGRYSENIESAVYFCCVEGLQNVGKHAGPSARAWIRLWERRDEICFEIEDDGVGYDADAVRSSGNGLANLSDRVAALGGTLIVESARGRGTTVRGTIPVAKPTAQ
jgi:signal transduction histidine kinase